MGVVKSISFILCLTFSSISCAADALREIPWPNKSTCIDCLQVELNRYQFQLPSSDVKSVSTQTLSSTVVDIQLTRDASQRGIALMELTPEKLTADFEQLGYFSKLHIKNTREFFLVLGKTYDEKSPGDIMRKTMAVDVASEYVWSHKDNLSAFWMKSNNPSSQSVYVVNDKEANVLFVGGAVTEELFGRILGTLRIR
ncbi:MAG: hypothetical protein OEZ43_11480 [Gammaproteobacteria bacterium]|nr:hypothetical protein [Gammaproteobacteria bacterium]